MQYLIYSLPEKKRIYLFLLDSKHWTSDFVNIFSEDITYSMQSLKSALEEELGLQIEADRG